MTTLHLARHAMATRFELVLQGEDERWLRAAGEEALAEIDRLEAQLSFYRPSSEVSRINALAASGPVQVEPRLFALLQTAQRLSAQTGGAFDPTVAPLMRCWGFVNDTGHLPEPSALAEARARTGMHRVVLDAASRTVAFERPGMLLDLGGIGKGYAVDEAMAVLAEIGVPGALLHGGTSTIAAMGRPGEGGAWSVAVPYPGKGGDAAGEDVLAVVALEDASLSVSAVWGKAFVAGGKLYGHVIDPRTGAPVEGAVLAAVATASATASDALSTALLVLGREGPSTLRRLGNDLRTVVLLPGAEPGRYEVIEDGLPLLDAARR